MLLFNKKLDLRVRELRGNGTGQKDLEVICMHIIVAMRLEKLLKKANILSKAIIGSRTEICGIPIFGWWRKEDETGY